jgi:hypothetical protein
MHHTAEDFIPETVERFVSFHFESVVNVATHHPKGGKKDLIRAKDCTSAEPDPGFSKKNLDPRPNPLPQKSEWRITQNIDM